VGRKKNGGEGKDNQIEKPFFFAVTPPGQSKKDEEPSRTAKIKRKLDMTQKKRGGGGRRYIPGEKKSGLPGKSPGSTWKGGGNIEKKKRRWDKRAKTEGTGFWTGPEGRKRDGKFQKREGNHRKPVNVLNSQNGVVTSYDRKKTVWLNPRKGLDHQQWDTLKGQEGGRQQGV